ncbi:type III secretion system export apparatus subunit SctS [Saccharospirillum salsuginis]|uniref:EscS/YscS/HrcS family type III secretion system export apparatus protein n=1 Tax=Saccharospirillum salsuginis TaxID=418750 RepID=A0A918KSI0_9GAMM|nr:type III secretion system export apparatus subunit SctS [Saccharospirillum salsuginis]GGX75402.1 EscS/YscS/HrcS family type III secretion system export apparatus protein [Saccharospirillum salsuginis]
MSFDIVRLTQDALWLMLMLSGPPILVAAIAGLLVAFIQAATQLQEQTLAFAVKLAAVVITLFLMGALLGETLYEFSTRIFDGFPTMLEP